ncbi:MAG: zinc-ribbon domain-containing protein, partial [Polyangiaceae bacterium]
MSPTSRIRTPAMDVQCERCKTEYEFDDALVTGRGTTVRCTQCGNQFKVRRPEGPETSEGDRWVVRTSSGEQHTFMTLRALQRAILAGQVSRGDELRRSGAVARSLGSISELESFFNDRASGRPPSGAPPPDASIPSAFPKASSIQWQGPPP